MRASDDFPINIIPKNDEEKNIIEEAKLWLDENIFNSRLGFDEHINNVIKLGRKIIPL